MSNPTPHKHAALIKQWADDPSQEVWLWGNPEWVPITEAPQWKSAYIYALGSKPTQPPRKMCSLAGVEFPMPEHFPLLNSATYYWAHSCGVSRASRWLSDSTDKARLGAGFIHLTCEAAEQHSKALLAANKQAIEGAR